MITGPITLCSLTRMGKNIYMKKNIYIFTWGLYYDKTELNVGSHSRNQGPSNFYWFLLISPKIKCHYLPPNLTNQANWELTDFSLIFFSSKKQYFTRDLTEYCQSILERVAIPVTDFTFAENKVMSLIQLCGLMLGFDSSCQYILHLWYR